MNENFNNFTNKLVYGIFYKILVFVIGFLIGACIFYSIMDFDYASDKDYEPLLKVEQSIIQNFDTVYTYSNTNITIADSNIIVSVHGDDCYINTYFDKEKNYVSTEKMDNTDPIWVSLLLLILGSACVSSIIVIAFLLILLLISYILETTCKKKNNNFRDLEV